VANRGDHLPSGFRGSQQPLDIVAQKTIRPVCYQDLYVFTTNRDGFRRWEIHLAYCRTADMKTSLHRHEETA
jgi:hypothetical protein